MYSTGRPMQRHSREAAAPNSGQEGQHSCAKPIVSVRGGKSPKAGRSREEGANNKRRANFKHARYRTPPETSSPAKVWRIPIRASTRHDVMRDMVAPLKCLGNGRPASRAAWRTTAAFAGVHVHTRRRGSPIRLVHVSVRRSYVRRPSPAGKRPG